jgi:hypothetical protein
LVYRVKLFSSITWAANWFSQAMKISNIAVIPGRIGQVLRHKVSGLKLKKTGLPYKVNNGHRLL